MPSAPRGGPTGGDTGQVGMGAWEGARDLGVAQQGPSQMRAPEHPAHARSPVHRPQRRSSGGPFCIAPFLPPRAASTGAICSGPG